jgi:hypothetical protein
MKEAKIKQSVPNSGSPGVTPILAEIEILTTIG